MQTTLYGPHFVHAGTGIVVTNLEAYNYEKGIYITLPLTGTKRPSPNPKKDHKTIIPPPPNLTLRIMYSSR